jgi:hypothetical protein
VARDAFGRKGEEKGEHYITRSSTVCNIPKILLTLLSQGDEISGRYMERISNYGWVKRTSFGRGANQKKILKLILQKKK